MLKALKTKVDEAFSNSVSPNEQNLNKYSKQPFMTISLNDELPELLRETFEFYNKITRKELKKTTTQAEKDILYECVFKMRCIYGGMICHRYLSLNRQFYAEAAEECNEWFKQVKIDHDNAKKEQIMNSESFKKEFRQSKE